MPSSLGMTRSITRSFARTANVRTAGESLLWRCSAGGSLAIYTLGPPFRQQPKRKPIISSQRSASTTAEDRGFVETQRRLHESEIHYKLEHGSDASRGSLSQLLDPAAADRGRDSGTIAQCVSCIWTPGWRTNSAITPTSAERSRTS